MKINWRSPFTMLGLVLLWRVLLLVLTVQPIPANDAFIFDGGVANWLKDGKYVIPCLEMGYPISSGEVYSLYPPVYQLALLAWMPLFGASALSMMAMHLVMFAVAAWLAAVIIKQFFPAETNYALAVLFLLAITFGDRPEDLANIFGMAALWLVTRQMAGTRHDARTTAGITIALLLALFTSVIVGAVYCGVACLASAVAWWFQRKRMLLIPFPLVVVGFIAVIFWVMHVHPLWWQGFLENGRKQQVEGGFHGLHKDQVLKAIRTLPVYLLAVAFLPVIWRQRKQLAVEPWLFLVAGTFIMGGVNILFALTLVSPNYLGYDLYLQILLAAGLLVLAGRMMPQRVSWMRCLLAACVVLVSIRAVGMTTWGAVCAWKNSYWHTRQELRTEFAPFETNNTPVVVSSAYLYSALEWGVKRPIHSDWYYDRGARGENLDFEGMVKLRPTKLVLTQFDYYRGFLEVLNKLREHPELVAVRVRDETAVRTPDASPTLQRVVQHISWAPVIVDLDWKGAMAPAN